MISLGVAIAFHGLYERKVLNKEVRKLEKLKNLSESLRKEIFQKKNRYLAAERQLLRSFLALDKSDRAATLARLAKQDEAVAEYVKNAIEKHESGSRAITPGEAEPNVEGKLKQAAQADQKAAKDATLSADDKLDQWLREHPESEFAKGEPRPKTASPASETLPITEAEALLVERYTDLQQTTVKATGQLAGRRNFHRGHSRSEPVRLRASLEVETQVDKATQATTNLKFAGTSFREFVAKHLKNLTTQLKHQAEKAGRGLEMANEERLSRFHRGLFTRKGLGILRLPIAS